MKKGVVLFCLTVVALFLSSHSVYYQDSSSSSIEEYRAELARYMILSGSDYGFKAIVDQMISMNAPSLSVEKKKEISRKAVEKLVDDMTPVYQKNISLDDLKMMNKFYETDVAKRVVKSVPAITKESMVIGQQWAISLQGLIQEASK
jgi:hypothetical protein